MKSWAIFHKVNRENPEFIKYHKEVDSGHGRIEIRSYRQLLMNERIGEDYKWHEQQPMPFLYITCIEPFVSFHVTRE